MIILGSSIVLFLLSLLLAIRASQKELAPPMRLPRLRGKKKGTHGVILFLAKKIVHYSSQTSS